MPEAAAVRKAPPGSELRWQALQIERARRVLFRRAPRPESAGWLFDLRFSEPDLKVWPSWLCGDPRPLRRAVRLLTWTDRLDDRVENPRLLAADTHEEAAALAREALVRLAPTASPRVEAAPARPLRSPPPRLRRLPP